jgi:hypothetical protein
MIYGYLSRPHDLQNLALTSRQLALEIRTIIYKIIDLDLLRGIQVFLFERTPISGPVYAFQP